MISSLLLAASLASSAGPAVAAHQHLISPEFGKIVDAPPQNAVSLLNRLDEAGIRKGLVLSMAYSFADERKKIADPDAATTRENDWTAHEVQGSGGRLIGFCSVNPFRAAAADEVRRCLRLQGMGGLKLHLGNSGISMRDPEGLVKLQAIFRTANERGTPIVVHLRARTGTDFGAEDARLFIDQVLPFAPRSLVQIAHFGGAGPGYPAFAQEVMTVFADAMQRKDKRVRNVYFDQATVVTEQTSKAEGRQVAAMIRRVGPKRVFFGSDMLIGDNPAPAASWSAFLTHVPLTRSEFETIRRNVPRYISE